MNLIASVTIMVHNILKAFFYSNLAIELDKFDIIEKIISVIKFCILKLNYFTNQLSLYFYINKPIILIVYYII